MEIEQEQRHDSKNIGRFIQIVKKDGFIIDIETASAFQTFCESSDNEDGKTPLGLICYHCNVAADTNKIISFGKYFAGSKTYGWHTFVIVSDDG